MVGVNEKGGYLVLEEIDLKKGIQIHRITADKL